MTSISYHHQTVNAKFDNSSARSLIVASSQTVLVNVLCIVINPAALTLRPVLAFLPSNLIVQFASRIDEFNGWGIIARLPKVSNILSLSSSELSVGVVQLFLYFLGIRCSNV